MRQAIGECLHREVAELELDEPLGEVLGIDSLAGLELMAQIETRLGVRFRDEHLAQPRTLGNMLAAIQAQEGRARSCGSD